MSAFICNDKTINRIVTFLTEFKTEFGDMSLLGDYWRDVLADIHRGVTEKEFLSSFAGSHTRKLKIKETAAKTTAIVDTPQTTAPKTDTEKNAAYDPDRDTIAKLTKLNLETDRLLAQQEKRIEILEGTVHRIERTLKRAKAG